MQCNQALNQAPSLCSLDLLEFRWAADLQIVDADDEPHLSHIRYICIAAFADDQLYGRPNLLDNAADAGLSLLSLVIYVRLMEATATTGQICTGVFILMPIGLHCRMSA